MSRLTVIRPAVSSVLFTLLASSCIASEDGYKECDPSVHDCSALNAEGGASSSGGAGGAGTGSGGGGTPVTGNPGGGGSAGAGGGLPTVPGAGGAPPQPPGKSVLQAEESDTTCATVPGTDMGATGGGYLNCDEGHVVTFSYVATTAGEHELVFSVNSTDGTPRTMGAFVNGTKAGVVTSSTKIPSWEKATLMATLTAGNNTIELRDSENAVELNVDALEVAAKN